MGVADLREAFNSVTEPKAACSRATLTYEQANDTEWQRLTFYGTDAAGKAFEKRSDRLRAGTDVNNAARETAKAFLADMERANGNPT